MIIGINNASLDIKMLFRLFHTVYVIST